jgi:hypothetical protein
MAAGGSGGTAADAAHPPCPTFLQAAAPASLLGEVDADMLRALTAGSEAELEGGPGGAGGGLAGRSTADLLARLHTGLRPIEQYAVRWREGHMGSHERGAQGAVLSCVVLY